MRKIDLIYTKVFIYEQYKNIAKRHKTYIITNLEDFWISISEIN